jgi:GlpG protein
LELRYYCQEKPLNLNTNSSYFFIISIAVLLSFLTNFGLSSLLEPFLFLKSSGSNLYPSFHATYIASQEWWRLITPTFLHFSLTHLIFNCLWIYILGSKIELIDGRGVFLTLFIISGLSSNLGQYFITGDYLFGGLSGVVYGLLGYCFILDLDNRGQRYDLAHFYVHLVANRLHRSIENFWFWECCKYCSFSWYDSWVYSWHNS